MSDPLATRRIQISFNHHKEKNVKSLTRLSVSGLFAVALAPPVFASDDAGLYIEKLDKTRVAILKEECVTGKPEAPEHCLTEAEDVMTGEVEEIDYITGTLVLNHRGARFKMHFPPAAIMDIRKGDTVAIPMSEEREAVP